MSDKFWSKLPDDLKANIKQALSEATAFEREETAKEDAHVIAELEKYIAASKKLEIYKIDDAQKAEWQKVMQSIYPKFYDVIGKDLIEKTLGTK